MKGQRIVYIDNLKVFLTCLVVAHHAAQAYGPTGGMWVVSDENRAAIFRNFFFINASFMMGLYFFISGYFMAFSIEKKRTRQFVSDRLKRLGIPLLIFTLFIFFPLNYLLSGTSLSPWTFFWDTYFNKAPMATGHLWFVASLLAYSLIYLFIRKIIPARPKAAANPLGWHHVFGYIVILSVITVLVRQRYPIDVWRTWIIPVEVAHIPQYFSMFLLGIAFNKRGWFKQLRGHLAAVCFLLAVGMYTLRNFIADSIGYTIFLEAIVESTMCVGISMGLIVLFRRIFDRQGPLLKLLSENSFAIYLIHLFVVIIFQKMLLPWNASAITKFTSVTLLAIFFSCVIASFLRKSPAVRTIL